MGGVSRPWTMLGGVFWPFGTLPDAYRRRKEDAP